MDKGFERNNAAVLRRLTDQAPAMLGYWDRELRCRFANRAYEDWFGIDAGTLLGSSLQELLGPELFVLNRPHVEAALRGEVQIFERSIDTPSGMARHSLAQYTPDTIDGRVLGFFVQVTDISQVKLTEAALRESEQRYRTLSELSPLGIFRARASGSITYSNLRWRQICGLGEEHGLGEGWKHTVHKNDQAAVFSALEEAVSVGREFELAFRIVHADGAERSVRCRTPNWQPTRPRG
jgi:PAS domain S-box-containing protein